MQKKTRIALIAFAALALPAGAAAQQTQPAAPAQAAAPAAPAPAQNEIQQIQQRLGELQQQALQDPAVKAQEQVLRRESVAALARLDPEAATKTARAEALRAEISAAQAAGDNAKLQTLAAEANALQAYFNALRPRMREDEQYKVKQAEFTAAVVAKMTEIDAQTPTLIARLQELRSGGTAPAAPAQPAAPAGSQQQ